jgi:HlyD family secretion protein
MAKMSTSLVARSDEAVLPAILEFQSPSAAILATPMPRMARSMVWLIFAMFFSCVLAMGLIPIDRVVSAQGKVVSEAAEQVVQPLEVAIVRSINVREGQIVHAGDVLAQLDPTFAAADVGALAASVSSLQAEVSRLQAEIAGTPFTYAGADPDLSLQAAIYAQRQAEKKFKTETYTQKINGLETTVARSQADATFYQQRVAGAERVEQMRTELERLQVGSKLNTLSAKDSRLEVERGYTNAVNTAEAGRRDLAGAVADRESYIQSWLTDTSKQLSDAVRKLSDAREQLNKAQLRRQLVELRAEKDATVLTVAHVSPGSVMQSGEQLITLVPLDAPLEIEANISGKDNGFVHLGDPVAIKFDTFQYSQYGMATGHVRVVSPDSFTAADDQRSHSPSAVPIASQSSEPFYRARIAIDEVKLHDTPPGFHLTPGMPVTADVKVGKRTVLAYLLGRVLPTTQEAMREP